MRHHLIAVARELCYAAGHPLRDRYGYAASDESVLKVVETLFDCPEDADAAQQIGIANVMGEIELAQGYDTMTSEEYELGIAAAVRPLVLERRAVEKMIEERS